jgi:hypothetical protein
MAPGEPSQRDRGDEGEDGETSPAVAEVFARRRFPRERELPGSWWKYYWRQVKTAALGDRQTENNAHFAF